MDPYNSYKYMALGLMFLVLATALFLGYLYWPKKDDDNEGQP